MGCCCPLSWAASVCCVEVTSWFIPLAPSPQIEECKNEYPDQIDKVPVEAADLDRRIVPAPVVIAAKHLARDDEQHDHAAGHMEAVEACDHEEACAELRRAHRVAPWPHTFFDELGPFESLHAHEHRAEQRRCHHQRGSFLAVAAITEEIGRASCRERV